MGTVLHSATFEGKHPDLAEVVEKVTEIAGLPVEVTELAHDPEFDLYDLEAEIQLAGFPETMLKLRCYRPGAVREYCGEGQDGFPMPEVVEGYEETEELRKVHMQAYVGQPPFLFDITRLALESLGGRLVIDIEDEVRKRHEKPVTATDFAEWERRFKRDLQRGLARAVVALPLNCARWLVLLLTLPWRLWKAYQADELAKRNP